MMYGRIKYCVSASNEDIDNEADVGTVPEPALFVVPAAPIVGFSDKLRTIPQLDTELVFDTVKVMVAAEEVIVLVVTAVEDTVGGSPSVVKESSEPYPVPPVFVAYAL